MNSRYGAKRTTHTRPVLSIIDVVCDDTRTAVAYFRILKQEVRDKKVVNVIPAMLDGAAAKDVVDCAIDRAARLRDPGDKIYVLIDLDTNPDIHNERAQAAATDVEVLASNPCYEVWTLAHLHDTGEAFDDCSAVLTKVKQKWKEAFGLEFGRKAQADYRKLAQFRVTAIERCRRRDAKTSQSWSEVWRAVEAILA